MRHGSLFSGIGGFDLASEWMGWENVFHCEWNPFGQKVLNYYWPNSITYNDITKTDFTIHRGGIDIITGGFPCQPYSSAGKRLGKEDERHLWPEMLRTIREIQPTWVVGENVRGLTNWNGGLVFDEVQADLEAEGYEVTPFLLPACAVNAPHRRDRIWFIAYSDNKGRSARPGQVQSENGEVSEWDNNAESSDSDFRTNATNSKFKGLQGCTESRKIRSKKREMGGERNKLADEFTTISDESNVTNSNGLNSGEGNRKKVASNRWKSSEYKSEGNKVWDKHSTISGTGISSYSDGIGLRGQGDWIRKSRFFDKEGKTGNWSNFPTVSPICTRDDGISDRLDSITFSKWRNESIKAGGNAIVPQVVHQIFKAIEQYETTRHTQGTQAQ